MAKKKLQRLEEAVDHEFEAVNLQNTLALGCQVTSEEVSSFSCNVKLQVSNDQEIWIDLANTLTSLNGSDSQIYDIAFTSVAYVRTVISDVVGNAKISVNYMLK